MRPYIISLTLATRNIMKVRVKHIKSKFSTLTPINLKPHDLCNGSIGSFIANFSLATSNILRVRVTNMY